MQTRRKRSASITLSDWFGTRQVRSSFWRGELLSVGHSGLPQGSLTFCASPASKRGVLTYIFRVAAVLLAFPCMLLFFSGCGGRPKNVGFPEAEWLPRLTQGGFEEGRRGQSIDLIILYTTEHAVERAKKLWRESESLSGHYMVTGEGKVMQFLKDSDAGWHAGNKDYNLRSIAIAVEGFADPNNLENPTKDLSWQTEELFDSLAKLIKWLCERHHIPMDRAHIIGKNQVPGVSTSRFPKGGPLYWGGASNKTSPGALWNWRRLMEKLGRKPVELPLTVLTNCFITTLPQANAPILAPASQGQKLEAYDAYEEFYLVVVAGIDGVSQPYLRSGRYHFDGWIERRYVLEAAEDKAPR